MLKANKTRCYSKLLCPVMEPRKKKMQKTQTWQTIRKQHASLLNNFVTLVCDLGILLLYNIRVSYIHSLNQHRNDITISNIWAKVWCTNISCPLFFDNVIYKHVYRFPGLETLQKAIRHWEEALEQLEEDNVDMVSSYASEFCSRLSESRYVRVCHSFFAKNKN